MSSFANRYATHLITGRSGVEAGESLHEIALTSGKSDAQLAAAILDPRS